jgi:hypothetical protein
MSMPDLRDEWQQHAKDNNEDVDFGHALLSKWYVEVAMDHRLFLWIRCLRHRVHSDIPNSVSNVKEDRNV